MWALNIKIKAITSNLFIFNLTMKSTCCVRGYPVAETCKMVVKLARKFTSRGQVLERYSRKLQLFSTGATLLENKTNANFISIQNAETEKPGGYCTKFYTGRLRPEVQTLTLLYTIFDRKGNPFIYLQLKHCIPFTTFTKLFA